MTTLQLKDSDNDTLKELLKECVDRPLELTIFNRYISLDYPLMHQITI